MRATGCLLARARVCRAQLLAARRAAYGKPHVAWQSSSFKPWLAGTLASGECGARARRRHALRIIASGAACSPLLLPCGWCGAVRMQSEVSFDYFGDTYSVAASRAYGRGDQLFISYGPQSNDSLMQV